MKNKKNYNSKILLLVAFVGIKILYGCASVPITPVTIHKCDCDTAMMEIMFLEISQRLENNKFKVSNYYKIGNFKAESEYLNLNQYYKERFVWDITNITKGGELEALPFVQVEFSNEKIRGFNDETQKNGVFPRYYWWIRDILDKYCKVQLIPLDETTK